jgi:hypothetical protein
MPRLPPVTRTERDTKSGMVVNLSSRPADSEISFGGQERSDSGISREDDG